MLNEIPKIGGPQDCAGELSASSLVQPLMPSHLPSTAIDLANGFARARPALAVSIGERALTLRFAIGREPSAGQIVVPLMVGEDEGRLWLDPGLAEWLIEPLETVSASCEPASGLPLAMLLELAALDLVTRIEKAGYGPVRLGVGATAEGKSAASGAADMVALFVTAALPGAEMALRIDLPLSLAAALLACLERLAPARPADPVHLPLMLRIEAGREQLPLRDIAGLGVGDVVLFDRPADVLRVEGGPVAPVSWVEDGVALDGPFAPGRDGAAFLPRMSMMDEIADVAWDDVPLTLVLEYGRLSMPLGDLRALGPGSVVELAGLTPARVDLVVNGARIAVGEMVRIGDGSGVRILRLADASAGCVGNGAGA